MFRKFTMVLTLVALTTAATYAEEHEQGRTRVLKASQSIGLNVVDRQNEQLGQINDLVVASMDDRVSHIIVSRGGVLGVGATLHPMPIEAARIVRDQENEAWVVKVDITQERFEGAPTMERDDLAGLADAAYAADLYRFYAVEGVDRRRADQALQTDPERADYAPERAFYKVSDLVGLEVRDIRKEDALGDLKEIVFESGTGKILYGALSFGGFLGFGEKLFAVPWDSIELARRADTPEVEYLALRMEISEETLREAEGFPDDNWPTMADKRFLAGEDAVPPRVADREEEELLR